MLASPFPPSFLGTYYYYYYYSGWCWRTTGNLSIYLSISYCLFSSQFVTFIYIYIYIYHRFFVSYVCMYVSSSAHYIYVCVCVCACVFICWVCVSSNAIYPSLCVCVCVCFIKYNKHGLFIQSFMELFYCRVRCYKTLSRINKICTKFFFFFMGTSLA